MYICTVMKLKSKFILSIIIVLTNSAFQLFAANGTEESKVGFGPSTFVANDNVRETPASNHLGGFEFSSDQTENKSRVLTTTNDEKFDDDETNSKKRHKVLKDNFLSHFFQNKFTYSLVVYNELDYHEHFISCSYSLYILLQVFRI